jgi:hypothetical protein
MNELEILQILLNLTRCSATIEEPVKDKYAQLVRNYGLHGPEQLLSLDDMSEEEEAVIRELRKLGLIETAIQYHGSDGHFYHIDLRGDKFQKYRPAHTPDDSKREIFPSGAVRDCAAGKSRPDLISPFAWERIGDCLQKGAEKYGEHNWTLGIPISRCMASLHRHLMKYMQGDKSEDHLAALVVNGIFVLHFETMVHQNILPESLLDLPDYYAIPRVHSNADEPYDT